MKHLVMAFAVASLGVVPSASGAILVFDGATLTSVQGLDVGGTFYDVTFVDGTCADVFSGCDDPAADFAFTDPIVAIDAASDLLVEVGSVPSDTTFGCTDTFTCRMVIPFALGIDGLGTAIAFNNATIDNAAFSGFALSGDTAVAGAGGGFVWANFQPAAATAVPEPATLALMTAGLAGIGARRWRHTSGGARRPRT